MMMDMNQCRIVSVAESRNSKCDNNHDSNYNHRAQFADLPLVPKNQSHHSRKVTNFVDQRWTIALIVVYFLCALVYFESNCCFVVAVVVDSDIDAVVVDSDVDDVHTAVNSTGTNDSDDGTTDDDDSNERSHTSEHTKRPLPVNRVDELRSKLYVNFTNITVDGAPSDIAANDISKQFGSILEKRLLKLFEKTKTHECRMKIAEHLSYHINAIATEESLPFTDVKFTNECNETMYDDWTKLPEGMNIGDIQNRTYQPNRNESIYMPNPNRMKLLYIILSHDNPNATIRLIEALYEDGYAHNFVIHVDGKYDSTQTTLVQYATSRTDVHIVPDPYRVRVNWGGFSMVNATLQCMRYAFALDTYPQPPSGEKPRRALMFHKLIHLSSSTYPIASNPEIRHTLSSYPIDANFLHVIMQPIHPNQYVWQYFVECDDAIHRIYQLPHLRHATHNFNLYTSSQWFIISRQFAYYLAVAEPGSVVDQYLRYIEHVVVADETFFGTILRHTKFCHAHHNQNFLHLQFDRWENTMPIEQRDSRKCPMPDPNHCGRSPTTMTVDYADIMELSADLFARKFDDAVDTQVKDIVDEWRQRRAYAIEHEGREPGAAFAMNRVNFEGHGVLIVAKDTINDPVPLCLAIGPSGNKVELLPCFESWVPATLASNWEGGAVILRETKRHTRWSVGPCTTDGSVERLDSGTMNVTLGKYSATGPRCMLQQMDGVRAGRCFDGGSTTFQPGGETQIYPCMREWYQFVSFGDSHFAPKGSLYSTIPFHIVKQIRALGHDHIPYMCLGVFDRGDKDEMTWEDELYEKLNPNATTTTVKSPISNETNATKEWEPLSSFKEAGIVTTQCNNLGAVIEWVFVPFIVDESDEQTLNISTSANEEVDLGTTASSETNQTVADDQEL